MLTQGIQQQVALVPQLQGGISPDVRIPTDIGIADGHVQLLNLGEDAVDLIHILLEVALKGGFQLGQSLGGAVEQVAQSVGGLADQRVIALNAVGVGLVNQVAQVVELVEDQAVILLAVALADLIQDTGQLLQAGEP